MSAGFLAVLTIHLHFPEAASLKGKRHEVASVKAQLRTRHGATVAETDHHDKWQRATLTAALAGRSAGVADEAADRVERWLDARFPAGVRVERTLASVEEIGV